MATGPQAFYCLWQDSRIRETLFEELEKEDICNVRLANSACCNLVTKRLFLRTNLTFTANSFTRQSRIQALSRIGHHIEHLTFYFPHSEATFLPPLIHPETGQEINFLYAPHTSMASVLERPKFTNAGLGKILTVQYPPLFHAASNVPSFIHAMKHLPNMRHLTVKTPGQDPKERYRRDIVDYALISLRIAMERAPMKKLNKLSLSSVHPSAFTYLRHTTGFGCLPSAGRRWKQIRKLHISVYSWDFYGPSPGLDHLKVIQDYISNFSSSLEKLTFTWLGRKGPCPVSLANDPLFAPPRSSQKLFHEVTSPMSPLPPAPVRKPIVFRKLRHLAVRNATMNESQVSALVSAHHHSVREFDFENTVLINAGSWDDALAPLLDNTPHGDHWSRHSTATITVEEPDAYTESPPEDISGPSAAVTAASADLSIDLNGEEGCGPEEPQPQEGGIDLLDLASDVEAAREASLSFTNKLKKRRITKRRRRRKPSHEREDGGDEQRRHHDRHQRSKDTLDEQQDDHQHRHHRQQRHQKSKDSLDEQHHNNLPPQHNPNSRQPSNESLKSGRPSEPPRLSIPRHTSRPRLFGEIEGVVHSPSASSHRLFGEVIAGYPSRPPSSSSHSRHSSGGSEPDLVHSPTDEADSVVDEYFRPPTPTDVPCFSPPPASSVYPATPRTVKSLLGYYNNNNNNNNNNKETVAISAPLLDTTTSSPSMPALLQPTVYDPTAELCSEISAVQRDMRAEEAQRLVAEDAEVQTSALRRAKELVLSRLGKEFSSSPSPSTGTTTHVSSSSSRHHHTQNHRHHGSPKKETFGGGVAAFLNSARFREGLFGGKNHGAAVTGTATGTMMTSSSAHHNSAVQDHRSMDVPILFSRG